MAHRPAGTVTFLGSFPSLATLPAPRLPEVAMAGRSNVGKSSAINAMLDHRVARVSRTPGRTQALNLFQIGERLTLVDLPGYGFARVPEAVRLQWKELVEGYLGERSTLALVVVLVDGSVPAQVLDIELIDGLRAARLPFQVVATRVDRLTKSARKPTLRSLCAALGIADDELIPLSSVTREGVDVLWRALETAARALPRR